MNECSGYTTTVYIGMYAYFIELSENGYAPDMNELIETVSCFPVCIITGDEPLKNKKDVSDLCKGVQKNNPDTKFVIRTNGYKYPSGLTSLKNVSFEVFLALSKSGVEFVDRVNEKNLKWYSNNGACFVVEVYDDDDFDEIEQIRMLVGIKNSQIFVDIKNLDEYFDYVRKCYHNGYNVYVNMEGGFFDE